MLVIFLRGSVIACDFTYYRSAAIPLAYFRMLRDERNRRMAVSGKMSDKDEYAKTQGSESDGRASNDTCASLHDIFRSKLIDLNISTWKGEVKV